MLKTEPTSGRRLGERDELLAVQRPPGPLEGLEQTIRQPRPMATRRPIVTGHSEIASRQGRARSL